ncbi:MAG: V-type ATP synthase subunit K [Lentisphaerae bacterium GWF2_52_8]|nr:MAG: V-type ATP synthase subunit K [Lentisphaerae bacterium GWF2_52_8]
MVALSQAGAYLFITVAALGSVMGTGAAGSAAVGAWKKCYLQNKQAPFQLVIFAGAPLSQTIYGMILMFVTLGILPGASNFWPLFLIGGVFGGLAMGLSAWWQGIAAAGACDALAESGKGFTNYLMILGIIETVAIFVMAFGIVLISGLKQVG